MANLVPTLAPLATTLFFALDIRVSIGASCPNTKLHLQYYQSIQTTATPREDLGTRTNHCGSVTAMAFPGLKQPCRSYWTPEKSRREVRFSRAKCRE